MWMPSLDLNTKHDLIYNLFQKGKIIENDFTGILQSNTSNLMTQISPYSAIQNNESIFPELGRGVEEKLGPEDPDKSVPYSYDTKNISRAIESDAERDIQIVTSNLVASEAEISILKENLTQLQLATQPDRQL